MVCGKNPRANSVSPPQSLRLAARLMSDVQTHAARQRSCHRGARSSPSGVRIRFGLPLQQWVDDIACRQTLRDFVQIRGLLPICTISGRLPFSCCMVLACSSGVMPLTPTTLLLIRALRPTIIRVAFYRLAGPYRRQYYMLASFRFKYKPSVKCTAHKRR